MQASYAGTQEASQGEIAVRIPDALCYEVPDAADTTCGVALLAAFSVSHRFAFHSTACVSKCLTVD